MKKLCKTLIWLVLIPLLVLGGALVGITAYIESCITPESVVALIEGEKNCRVEVMSCHVSILDQPASITLKGVTFTPRDAFADNATPLANRPKVDPGTTAILCPSVVLKVRLWDLLVRKLQVNELELQEPEVRFSIKPGGGNTLKPILAPLKKKMDTSGGADPAPKTPKPKSGSGGSGDSGVPGAPPGKKKFHVSQLPLQSTLKLAHLNGGTLKMFVEKSGAVIEVKVHDFSFSDINVNPYDLDSGNTATMHLDCTIAVDDPAENLRYTELHVGIDGGIIPFEPDTGFLNPDMKYDVVFKKGTYVQSVPFMEKLGNSVKELKEIGLKLDELGQKETLSEDQQARVGYRDDTIRLIDPLVLPFDNYQLTLSKYSWIQTAKSEHKFGGNVLISNELTTKALDEVERVVRGKIGGDVAAVARKLVDPILTENQISLDFRSEGSLGKPKLKIDNPISSIKDALREQGKSLLDRTLDIFGGDRDE